MTTEPLPEELPLDVEPAPRTAAERLRAALWPGEWREALARWVIVALSASLAITALALHPWLWWVVAGAGALTLAVQARRYRAAQAAVEEPEDDEPDEELAPEPEPDDELPVDLDPDDVADIVRELIGDGRAVHLATITRQLAAETGTPWTTAETRALLAASGIPVRGGVRVPPVGVREGVHRDDVPSPAPAAPSRPTLLQPPDQQSGNNNNSPGPNATDDEEGRTVILREPRWKPAP